MLRSTNHSITSLHLLRPNYQVPPSLPLLEARLSLLPARIVIRSRDQLRQSPQPDLEQSLLVFSFPRPLRSSSVTHKVALHQTGCNAWEQVHIVISILVAIPSMLRRSLRPASKLEEGLFRIRVWGRGAESKRKKRMKSSRRKGWSELRRRK